MSFILKISLKLKNMSKINFFINNEFEALPMHLLMTFSLVNKLHFSKCKNSTKKNENLKETLQFSFIHLNWGYHWE